MGAMGSAMGMSSTTGALSWASPCVGQPGAGGCHPEWQKSALVCEQAVGLRMGRHMAGSRGGKRSLGGCSRLKDEGFFLAKQPRESYAEREGGLVQGPQCRAFGDTGVAATLGPPSPVGSHGKSPMLLLAGDRVVGHEAHRKKRIFWKQVQKRVPPSLASPPNPATPRHHVVFGCNVH